MHDHFINSFLALIVLIFAVFGWSNEVVIIGSALILIFSFVECRQCKSGPMKSMKKKPTKKKRK